MLARAAPEEALISRICAEFHCTPTEAYGQKPVDVFRVLDYREAVSLRELHNTGKVTEMGEEGSAFWLKLNKLLDEAD